MPESPLKINTIQKALEATVIEGANRLEETVDHIYASDLMSDVLAFAKPGSLLLTGLTNPQVIRTSDVLDIAAIILVRGKRPLSETIQLAEELRIPLLTTKFILFEAVGRLYAKGIRGCIEKVGETRDLS